MSVDGDTVTFASTDSFRLSEYVLSIATTSDQKFSIIVPARTVQELSKILQDDSEITLYISENQLLVLYGKVRIFSRLLNGHFPDYKVFFPQGHATRGEILRSELIVALKQVSLISKEISYNTKLIFESGRGIELNTGDTEIGAGKVTVPANVEGNDDHIGVNSTYLLDVLNVIKDDYVSLDFQSNLAPILVQGVPKDGAKKQHFRYQHIIMPLKI